MGQKERPFYFPIAKDMFTRNANMLTAKYNTNTFIKTIDYLMMKINELVIRFVFDTIISFKEWEIENDIKNLKPEQLANLFINENMYEEIGKDYSMSNIDIDKKDIKDYGGLIHDFLNEIEPEDIELLKIFRIQEVIGNINKRLK